MKALGEALLESDRTYFELGARVVALEAAALVCMPGLESVPGSSVVQRVQPEEMVSDPGAWVEQVVELTAETGCAMVRVYLPTSPSPLDGALRAAGFRCRTEIGYIARGEIPGAREGVSLRPVDDAEAWEAKLKLHARSRVAADGHAAVPDDWVELERRKCATGGMRCFLVEVEGSVCGSVATLDSGDLLRAKNLFVHPDRRREGIATRAMRLVSTDALARGKAATGIFGVDGKPGNAVYRHVGMVPAVHQFEWSRPLGGDAEEKR